MNLNAYCFFDRATKDFTQPFYAFNDALAERTVINILNSGASDVAKHCWDFDLYCVAIFDTVDGKLTNEDSERMICKVSDIKERISNGTDRA